MNGTWTATDSLQRVMSLTLTQRGDSIYGSGTVDGGAVTVLGANLWPDSCNLGSCLRPVEVTLAVTDAASDTMFMGGFFGAGSNHVSIIGASEWPLLPGFPFALDTLTLVRVLH